MCNSIKYLNLEEVLQNEGLRRELIELYIETWKEPPWNEDFWTPELVDEDIEFGRRQNGFNGVVAICEVQKGKEEIVGFTWGYELPIDRFLFLREIVGNRKPYYVDELAVKREYRKRGIGTNLTELLLKRAEELGYEIAVLRTEVESVAYLFYKKQGFRDTNVRDPQYPTRTYMVRDLKINKKRVTWKR